MSTYRKNLVESLRNEVVALIETEISPIALAHRYCEVPLEVKVRWRPLVLVLGNYSSGKSTLINELLGADVQKTGQAPTDDAFTVLTGPVNQRSADGKVLEERDGNVLLNDPQYPFEVLQRHGQRFSSHFRLKVVDAPILEDLAIIDTPGMLDSMAERDRGYNYQDVIGDLAQIADLVLVLFDPHKAGTVRESHQSLRETLPLHTLEDRVVFVLNRIDECTNLSDLLRVYGTLCWNLSQMTGRKDIPQILMTYSSRAAVHARVQSSPHLELLENERARLLEVITSAPKHRLDHLASFFELHCERLTHFLEAKMSYLLGRRRVIRNSYVFGFGLALLSSVAVGGWLRFLSGIEWLQSDWVAGAVALVVLIVFLFAHQWLVISGRQRRYRLATLRELNELTPLTTQRRRDSWAAVQPLVKSYVERSSSESIAKLARDIKKVKATQKKGSREARTGLAELSRVGSV